MTYFDVFFRTVPDNGGFAIAAGLEQVVEYIRSCTSTTGTSSTCAPKTSFQRGVSGLSARTSNSPATSGPFRRARPLFPREPILTVSAPAIQAQLLETYVLLAMNHQSLIATKANRIVRAARGRAVLEFGSRRAQGIDGAVTGARAAFIGGCAGTACAVSDEVYGVPAAGTMAHSWVQMFDTEYDAFAAYCKTYPTNAVLLVDTYNSLKSGVPNAIRAFNEVLRPWASPAAASASTPATWPISPARPARCWTTPAGRSARSPFPTRWTSGLSPTCSSGRQIDSFGVGERLITARSEPVFGGVYKLAAVEDAGGAVVPKIKVSENVGKITNPGFKRVYRFYDRESGMAEADYICLARRDRGRFPAHRHLRPRRPLEEQVYGQLHRPGAAGARLQKRRAGLRPAVPARYPDLLRQADRDALAEVSASTTPTTTMWISPRSSTAILSLILSPDKESALLYAALGYYPVLKPKLDRLPGFRRLVCKLALYNAAVCASYALMLFVLRMDALRQEFFSEGKWMLLALVLGGNAVFILYDLLLNRISPVLCRLLHTKRRR
jgi:nicotinate phosphoribosyltransferase